MAMIPLTELKNLKIFLTGLIQLVFILGLQNKLQIMMVMNKIAFMLQMLLRPQMMIVELIYFVEIGLKKVRSLRLLCLEEMLLNLRLRIWSAMDLIINRIKKLKLPIKPQIFIQLI